MLVDVFEMGGDGEECGGCGGCDQHELALSVCGLKLLLYATSVCGLKLLVYEALRYSCMRL